ncbi:hypothetical protein Patl1_30128 [Pistacia atlantica]|uniref:Uncharacterized protein n=1 Tax=Pistacia atlantica TaxID=434234 RepID=A0ACC1ACX5_9ROSI|nr:hypothetical protein Patl1_30128 [Pistacia atlantica]
MLLRFSVPGSSSLGLGAMAELGPFRLNSDGKTLFQMTMQGTMSDAGHYVPQLANEIMLHNKYSNQTVINLKGIAIGNGVLNDVTDLMGDIDYVWTHALISDETYKGILKYCDLVNETFSEKCEDFLDTSWDETIHIDRYNIYAPLCHSVDADYAQGNNYTGSVNNFDPCSDSYVYSYLNIPEVQTALHANHTEWSGCSDLGWNDSPSTALPIIESIMASGISVWIYRQVQFHTSQTI